MPMYGKKFSNMIQTIIYLIHDLDAKLTASNVEVINQLTELSFSDVNNVTYRQLIEARKQSLGNGYGYEVSIQGVKKWVLPSIPMGLVVDPSSVAIKEYTEQEYKTQILPLIDVNDEIF